ncbi:BREX-3 system P-loop-containing protein BrxF [Pseudomonas sp. KT_2_4]|uniref:BREX-3 system P-loop-containing protein BrxF n=1 Tax=Pseudomonas sp. KT_2_4 TaxID=3241600 RepID=UPI00352AC76D
MLSKLERLVDEIGDLNSKLILLVGLSRSGKTHLLRQLAVNLAVEPLNISAVLARRLAAIPKPKRSFAVGEELRDICVRARMDEVLLLDNLELLFEPGLQIHPLELLKGLAHYQRVVAVWPGELRGDRLIYADLTHQEHCDYSREGVVIFEI